MHQPHFVLVGGGHNGLVCAAYLARTGADVTLLERREVWGGACVTEPVWSGYRVSRAAYVLSLFRPCIVRELGLERFGLRLLPRSPASITPLPDGRSLVLGSDLEKNQQEIRRFSEHDARAYPGYEAWLRCIAEAIEPTLDAPPPEPAIHRMRELHSWGLALRAAWQLRRKAAQSARLLLGPARALLEERFDSEPLRTTLASDAIIGAFASPSTAGTGYVLFHHVMGSVGGARGVWAYVQGGMGALSDALVQAARASGAKLRAGVHVERILTRSGRVAGVRLENGEELEAEAVVSSLDPARSFAALDDPDLLPEDFRREIASIDFRSPVVKINLALDRLPCFRVHDRPELPLTGTIHLGPTDLDQLESAFEDARAGRVSQRPVVELTIPSILDPTLAPPGHHVASIFAQYAPIKDANDSEWPALRDQMRDSVLGVIEEVAPGFTNSIEAIDLLAPPDLERVFGLTGGNIFHGAMTPDRLFALRPVPGWSRYRTPVPGLYLCGSGTHPGGGVMGAPGRNAAREILRTRDKRASPASSQDTRA